MNIQSVAPNIEISDKLFELLESRRKEDQNHEDVIWDIITIELETIKEKLRLNQEENSSKNIFDQNIVASKQNKDRSTLSQRIQRRKAVDVDFQTISEDGIDEDMKSELGDASGPIEENIITQKFQGMRITLKDRIEQRKLDSREKYPEGIPTKNYLDQDQIPLIIKYFLNSGVTINDYREKYFLRILKKRLIRLNYSSYAEYFSFLKINPLELTTFRDALSINVTRFLRNREVWTYINDDIFPMLVNQARMSERKVLRIWSAGCAIGAEPYSLTLLWSQIGLNFRRNIELEITATDIKQELLKKAKEGIYIIDHLTELTESEISSNFNFENDKYVLNSTLKNQVSFSRLDLVNDTFGRDYDMIMCRNVFFYLDDEAKKKIIGKFLTSLHPGGILVMGKSEKLYGIWDDKFVPYSNERSVYQKRNIE